MRVFQVLEARGNTILPQSRTWYRNLYEPLLDLGHDVLLLDAREGWEAMMYKDKARRSNFSQRLLDTFRQEHRKEPFDLFFAYLMDGMVDPEVIDEIRRLGVPTCNFSCNNIHQFDLVDELAPHFDYNLHSERDARIKFEQIGAKAIWWPMASNPKYFKPMNIPRDLQVSFVGANYALRARYIGYLLEQGIEVHVFGPGWRSGAKTPLRSWAKYVKLLLEQCTALTVERQYRAAANLADHTLRRYLSTRFPRNLHDPISDEALVALYSRSQISLGFLEVYDGHDASRTLLQHLHLREFEAPMAGALYCTGYTDELAEFFEPDREVLIYRNQFELLEKIRYYLAHPEQAEQIRRAGHARALRDHTYHRRYQSLFEIIGL